MNHDKLYEILLRNKIFAQKELDAYVHALVDINESLTKIYTECVNNILSNGDNKDAIINAIWDIREEFRHITYHIDDAKLTD